MDQRTAVSLVVAESDCDCGCVVASSTRKASAVVEHSSRRAIVIMTLLYLIRNVDSERCGVRV